MFILQAGNDPVDSIQNSFLYTGVGFPQMNADISLL
jgi:hypothetical protein